MWGDAGPDWQPDVLGDRFEQLTLPLGIDGEGDVVATLVRHMGRPRLTPGLGVDVLYVHGWSDYFFNRELADFWTRRGARFFALDLRKYGRSIRPGQTPGFITSLDDYDADIEAALDAMGHGLAGSGADGSRGRPLVLLGHSTGGLTLSLWASRHPGRAAAVILNSPWLEFQATGLARGAITPLVGLHARVDPKAELPSVDAGFYARSVDKAQSGYWEYNKEWRPLRAFPTHPAWLAAVLAGHAKVQAGLSIDVPVLTLISARSTFATRWSDDMLSSDIVLVVDDIARRALKLGPTVTIDRIDGAIHDVFLSAPEPRARAYAAVASWLAGYAPR
ncbi:alpha/beta hydrolase [Agromyces atrinae]|uniref:alpha/beta hydrolase n=1 Tax=Agromyces atrinae TaxID=592376 RepID=UPI001F5AAC36|nr:alpha/beta hydrolase [Agromyces atrinae]MCI2957309.1 alpha/beta hydrolase [Agromyces atrinae]